MSKRPEKDRAGKERRAKKRRVLLLVHEDHVPPESMSELSETEIMMVKAAWDVRQTLRKLGHEVQPLGLLDELAPLRRTLEEFRPHIVFNLLDVFRGATVYDHAVVSYLELMGVPYTGCNPRGLVLGGDKALTKKILHYHRIRVPAFAVFPRNRRVRRPRNLSFPLIVKSPVAEGSEGIAQASVVHNDDAFGERVRFVHETIGTSAIAEQYIEGRELYAGVLGNHRLQVLPLWELHLEHLPPEAAKIATDAVKWNLDYQEKHKIRWGRARGLSDALVSRIQTTARRIYRALDLSGYARLDLRLTEDEQFYLIEANPNPDISRDEELASAAKSIGVSYDQLIQKLLNLGLRYKDGG
jgi:D-alanine-D-alanine ligase